MCDSYKKYAKCPDKAGRKKEHKQLHSRRYRRILKEAINNIVDYEEIFLPQFYPEDWAWDSYHWCDCAYKVPALNQCEVDKHKYKMSWGQVPSWLIKYGHGSKYCNCYTNKNSKYWKARRK